MEAISFLEELVRCYSPSQHEGQVAIRAVEVMQSLGFSEARVDEAGNAVGVFGNPTGPTIMLLGHIDTVPGEILVRREVVDSDERLYGRGAVDAKGPFATFVQAVSRLPKDFPHRVVVVGAVEEEVRSSKGARYILGSFQPPECVVIGEPSGGDGITLGYKGRLLLEFQCSREMAHSASPFLSIGDYLSLWAERVHRYARERNEGRPPGFRTLDVTVQKLSVTHDGFIEKGELEIGFRLGPEYQPSDVERDLMEIFSAWKAELLLDTTFCHSIECCQHEVPAEYSRKSVLAGAFRKAVRECGKSPRHVLKTGTSDMNVLASEWSCPMVAYGPGDSSLDHTPHEHISLSEYLSAIDILTVALQEISRRFI